MVSLMFVDLEPDQGLECISIVTHGDKYSYHAAAARQVSYPHPVEVIPREDFGDVVHDSRSDDIGLGVIAIRTVVGTVADSAKELIFVHPSSLPHIVARVDVKPVLALIGSAKSNLTLEELGEITPKSYCVAQKAAWEQTEAFRAEHLPWIRPEMRKESTAAVREMVERNDPRWVAIGPNFAAEPLGGVVIADQINPVGSETSMYVLQRDPRENRLPVNPEHTSVRSVISVAHPGKPGQFDRVMELAVNDGIEIARFIPFNKRGLKGRMRKLQLAGGILEVEQGRYKEQVTDFCSRVNTLFAEEGIESRYGARVLGEYPWFPEPALDPLELSEMVASTQIRSTMSESDRIQVNRQRAVTTIEKICPGMDMSWPYGEFAVSTIAGFVAALREHTNASKSINIIDVLNACSLAAREELRLAETNVAVQRMQAHLPAVAGWLVRESELS